MKDSVSDNLSSLELLEELLNIKKNQQLELLQSKLLTNNTIYIYNTIFESINSLKDLEKEKSRIDWKKGYIESVIHCGETFGNTREESYPTNDDLEVIDRLSHDFIYKKNI
jgi:hypothetical protein